MLGTRLSEGVLQREGGRTPTTRSRERASSCTPRECVSAPGAPGVSPLSPPPPRSPTPYPIPGTARQGRTPWAEGAFWIPPPPGQGDARGSADARSSADAGLS